MDDYNINLLSMSKNEWSCRIINIITPLVMEGYNSIFETALSMCEKNNEQEKYLMAFQNLILRIPKWNQTIIETETKRIVEKSRCSYLEDLITCVHIVHLKALTAMRVGNKQKQININIPKLDVFIHKVYINSARKLYQNVYLFEKYITPLQIQKNKRETEIIVNECVLNTIRDSIPLEEILKSYLEETIEEETIDEVKEEVLTVKEPKVKKGKEIPIPKNNLPDVVSPPSNNLTFNNIDSIRDDNNNDNQISAPKTIDRLEKISEERYEQRKKESLEEDDDDDGEKITLTNEDIKLDFSDIEPLKTDTIRLLEDDLDIEVLA